MSGPIGTVWNTAEPEPEQNLPREGLHISDARDSAVSPETKRDADNQAYFMSGYDAGQRDAAERPLPTPVRTLESHGVQDQTSEEWHAKESCIDHYMLSIKTNSDQVPYVERCFYCGWIDGHSLNWWANNAIKLQLNGRMQRIAVSAESEPFAFVQSSTEDLPLEEILFQALGAASLCWEGSETFDVNRFKGDRARSVADALLAEIQRYVNRVREDAATRGVAYLMQNNAHKSSDAFYLAVRRAIENPAE